MKKHKNFLISFLLILITLVKSIPNNQKIKDKLTEDFVKVRCSKSGDNQIFTFNGSVFNYMPQQKPQLLFKILGYNIARCVKDSKGNWNLLTRELMYYLDPNTGEKLSKWENPFTKETVNVVHVSNDPVNNPMGPLSIELIGPEQGLYIIDVPLFYPNPLFDNKFVEYTGKDKFYEAGEFFKFYFNIKELEQSENSLKNVSIAWNRDSPYFPWMKMKDIQGRLVISAYGGKTDNLDDFRFPYWLKLEIRTRLRKYLNAPEEYVTPNETSVTYFKKHFEEYLNWEQFPLKENSSNFNLENKKNENILEDKEKDKVLEFLE